MSSDRPVYVVQSQQSDAVRLRLAVMRLARLLRQEAGDPVTASQLSALVSVERLGPVTLGSLAAAERVQPPSMTRIVAALEEQGLVARAIDDADRRVARVSITEEGRELLERSRGRRTAFLAGRLGHLSAEERTLLEEALPVLERLVDGPA